MTAVPLFPADPDVRVRHTDPVTSLDAVRQAQPAKRTAMAWALDIINAARAPLTVDQIEKRMRNGGWSGLRSTLHGAVSRLVEQGAALEVGVGKGESGAPMRLLCSVVDPSPSCECGHFRFHHYATSPPDGTTADCQMCDCTEYVEAVLG